MVQETELLQEVGVVAAVEGLGEGRVVGQLGEFFVYRADY